jgi:DNA-directed RNA polymerase specialized sigma24 family protein
MSDEVLVQRCLTGDQRAWQALHARYHVGLLHFALRLLAAVPDRADLAEDILGEFWCALVEHGRDRLRRFDPARGRLRAFLATLVRQRVQTWYRESRRPGQLVPVPRVHRSAPRDEPLSLRLQLEELEQRLSPSQRRFLREHLLAPAAAKRAVSDRGRKARQRIGETLRAYLAGV